MEEEVTVTSFRKTNLDPQLEQGRSQELDTMENTSSYDQQFDTFEDNSVLPTSGTGSAQERRVVFIQRKHHSHHKTIAPWVKTLLGAIAGLLLGITFTYWMRSGDVGPEIKEYIKAGKYITIHDENQMVNLFVLEDGPSQNTEAVLLVDGPPGSFFERQTVPLMAYKGKIRSIAFDFPGVGVSEKSLQSSYDSSYLSERILDVCDKLNVTKAHLVLHGLMGPVGSQFAINHPDRVATITFVNTFLNTSAFYHTFPVSFLTVRYMRHLAYEFMTNSIFNVPKWLLLRWKYGDKFDYETSKLFGSLLSANGKWPLFKILGGINSTLVQTRYLIQGLQQRCPMIPMQTIMSDCVPNLNGQVKYLRDYLPQIRREVTLSGGFWPQLDEPRDYVDSIIRFVNQHRFNRV